MKPIDSFSGAYRFLSNFYPAAVEYQGQVYPTSEHAYQAAKTLDEGERRLIRETPSPGTVKRLGMTVTLRKDWEEVKLQVMEQILLTKFSERSIRAQLLHTYDRQLVEGNTWGDTYWGVCKGVGENRLGVILMKVRATLRAQVEQEAVDNA